MCIQINVIPVLFVSAAENHIYNYRSSAKWLETWRDNENQAITFFKNLSEISAKENEKNIFQ